MVAVSNSGGPHLTPVTLVAETVATEAPESADDLEMPLPNPQTFFLGGLFILSAFGVLYLASSIILPVVLAFVLKLLLQPAVRLFERVYSICPNHGDGHLTTGAQYEPAQIAAA